MSPALSSGWKGSCLMSSDALFFRGTAWWAALGPAPNGASLSLCCRYRTLLWRAFNGETDAKPLVFCMLNPSTADGFTDDATIRRCLGFARRERAGGIVVVNLSPWRATDPKDLQRAYDAHEDVLYTVENEKAVALACAVGGLVVVAWGAGVRAWMDRAAFMVRKAAGRDRVRCLGKTKMGEPRHPLMLASNSPLVPFP